MAISKIYIATLHGSVESKEFKTLSAAQRWLDKKEMPTGFRYFGDDSVIIVRHRTYEDRSPAYR